MTPGAIPNAAGSIDRAIEAGADLVELDVRLTLDRRPVLVHDAMLRGTTTGRGWVRLWPGFALRRLHLVLDPDRTVEMLDDVIGATSVDAQLALHLKDRGALGPVLQRLHRAGAGGRTWLWLEHARDVRTATRSLPELRVTLLRPTGWGPTVHQLYFAEAQWVGAAAVSLPAGLIDEPMVAAAHHHQLRVFTRIDDPAQASPLAQIGVDGFITTDPGQTQTLLAATANLHYGKTVLPSSKLS